MAVGVIVVVLLLERSEDPLWLWLKLWRGVAIVDPIFVAGVFGTVLVGCCFGRLPDCFLLDRCSFFFMILRRRMEQVAEEGEGGHSFSFSQASRPGGSIGTCPLRVLLLTLTMALLLSVLG